MKFVPSKCLPSYFWPKLTLGFSRLATFYSLVALVCLIAFTTILKASDYSALRHKGRLEGVKVTWLNVGKKIEIEIGTDASTASTDEDNQDEQIKFLHEDEDPDEENITHKIEAKTHDDDVQKFRQWILNNQNPLNCSRKEYIADRHIHGLGSVIHVMANSLLEALSMGRVFKTDHKLHYVSTSRCPSGGYECLFQNYTSCGVHGNDSIRKKTDCFDIQNAKFHELAQLSRSHGTLFYMRQAVWYLTRPNKHLERVIDKAWNQIAAEHGPNLLSVHIRRTDKREGIQHKTKHFAAAINHTCRILACDAIFLGSDDTTAKRDLERLVSLPVVMLPDFFFQPRISDAYSNAANWLNLQYESIQPHVGDIDEGIAIMTQIFLMAKTGQAIVTMSSNYGRLLYELLPPTSRTNSVFDMDGGMYYECWYGSEKRGKLRPAVDWDSQTGYYDGFRTRRKSILFSADIPRSTLSPGEVLISLDKPGAFAQLGLDGNFCVYPGSYAKPLKNSQAPRWSLFDVSPSITQDIQTNSIRDLPQLQLGEDGRLKLFSRVSDSGGSETEQIHWQSPVPHKFASESETYVARMREGNLNVETEDTEKVVWSTGKCGYWQDVYRSQHDEIVKCLKQRVDMKLANSTSSTGSDTCPPNFRVLVFSCGEGEFNGRHSGGISDRFVGLVSMFALAVFKGWAFLIDWRGPGGEQNFLSHAYDFGIDIEWNEEYGSVAQVGELDFISENVEGMGRAFQEVGHLEKLPVSEITRVRLGGGRLNTMYKTEFGAAFANAGFPSYDSAYGCFFRFLFYPSHKLRLRHKNIDLALQQARQSGHAIIGIQIRVGDKAAITTSNDRTSVKNYLPYFTCGELIEKAIGKTAKWFLVSDSQQLKENAMSHFGDKIISDPSIEAPFYQNYSSSSALIGPVGENWLLGNADYHIISMMSGFGRTAAFLSLRDNNIFNMPYNTSDQDCKKHAYCGTTEEALRRCENLHSVSKLIAGEQFSAI
eukprot:CAMPEP_0184485546 /NCGR_PEP_ID=MMETSP0113_2-20130426/7124_1 /TAXON_ID=91329 /ORGANISM="Norrisiella sphaerica, Strain BC52" /LENGTH=989 /DNA_ID=CAMNT_0026867023 /DNA_START=110 /DNA_END=3079 /DNA_ORIENTATION=+